MSFFPALGPAGLILDRIRKSQQEREKATRGGRDDPYCEICKGSCRGEED